MNTMSAFGKSLPLLGIIFSAFSFAPSAHAASRIIYFNATGTNRTTVGLSTGANSTCVVTINNPSLYSETVIVTGTVDSLDGWVDINYATPTAATGPTSSTATCSAGSCTATIATTGSATFTWTFSQYPAKPASSATYGFKQVLRCSGSISVTDVTTPGFLVGTGVLTTFVESAIMKTEGSTTNSNNVSTFGGIPVYTQIPIAINRSKPF